MAELWKGDEVTWKSHGGDVVGRVVKKITTGGRKMKASKDEPQYLVRSDTSGGEAARKHLR